ncbi:MlaD family protein [Conexibacter sp. SYSU D00693]|uniref:MlaD family protein n=1 Tax=Conexibacter sp. SYSU D00693 TaxID=2812560 RepID=UPI00196B88D9|nr:MlaD family protein [Conexibacter sp. SYSU D00693]
MSVRRVRHTVDPARSPRVLATGALTVLVALAVLVVAMRSSSGLPGQGHYEVRAQVAQRPGTPVLPPRGSDVRIAGKRVGRTQQARLERGVATIELQLDQDAGPLPVDSRVHVRAQGLLGAKYVDVVPGSDRATVDSGGVLAPDGSSVSVTLSEALQAFDAPSRAALSQMLRGLGGGLAGRGARLNEGLDDLATGFERFSLALRPVLHDRSLPALVRDAEGFAGALDPVREELGRSPAAIERAVRPFAQERPSVARLLRTAPGALEGVRADLGRTDPVLARAERFARAATAFTRDAPRALRSATTLLRDGRAPLGAARRVLRTADAAIPPALRLTGALGPVLPRLDTVLETSRAPVRTLGEFGCDVQLFGRTWRSMLGFAPAGQEGPLGPLTVLRASLTAGAGIPGAPALTPGVGNGVDGTIEPCEERRRP